jgi:hypothetical protein
MLLVDIPDERIGPFKIGDELPLPAMLKLDDGSAIQPGDALYLEPYKGAYVTLDVRIRDNERFGCLIESGVDDLCDAEIFGTPMSKLSLKVLMSALAKCGVYRASEGETVLYLTDHATLGVLGDTIENVWFGADALRGKRKWKPVRNPQTVQAIVDAAVARRR